MQADSCGESRNYPPRPHAIKHLFKQSLMQADSCGESRNYPPRRASLGNLNFHRINIIYFHFESIIIRYLCYLLINKVHLLF
jgi:hypothetical protein